MAGKTGRHWVRRDGEQAAEMVQRFGRSGLTQREFCEREGISRNSLRRWQQASEGLAKDAPVARRHEAAFVDLGALAGGGAGFEIRLELGGGVVLHLVRH